MSGISSKALAFGEPKSKYKYNGKEEQRQEFSDGSGLETYDYGARVYDVQTGRWWQPDPLAEKYFSVTPYKYCLNNPISLLDPDGRDAQIFIDWEKHTITITSIIYFKWGNSDERQEYINAANEFMKEYANSFSGKYTDKDGNEWSMSINVDYQDAGEKDLKDLKDGENIIDLSRLDDPAWPRSKALGGTRDITEYDPNKGIHVKVGEEYHTAGKRVLLAGDSRKNKGMQSVHESLHLLGLTDRYDETTSKPRKGFEKDMMSGAGTEMHQTHWNNWGKYILSQPEIQQQRHRIRPSLLLNIGSI